MICVIFIKGTNMNTSQNPSAIRSKKEITEALLQLMEKYPYEEISVKQIVLETDLVRKTFYRNFSSKDDVLRAYIDTVIREYVDELIAHPEDPLDVIFSFCEKKRNLFLLLDKNNMLYMLLLRLNEMLPEIRQTSDMSRNPFVRLFGELEPDYLIAFNVGAIWNVIFRWVRRGMLDPLVEVRNTLEKYLRRVASDVAE